MVKTINRIFAIGYIGIIILFFCCALSLIAFAVLELWGGLNPASSIPMQDRFNSVLECIGLLTIAVAALELGQTIVEEEVLRTAPMSAPTRVRRFLSRFMVVVIVSLAAECLVAVFQSIHGDMSRLPQASAIGIATGVLLAAWGVFLRFNKDAEELEPEAMKEAKSEDEKVSA
jgi:hypothetical protein